MDYESVKYVEGFIDNIIYRNEDNGYTVFEIIYQGEDVTCVGTLSISTQVNLLLRMANLSNTQYIICSLRFLLMNSRRRRTRSQ